MATRIQQRRDTAANWATVNPVLGVGEIGYATDTTDFKVGDGSTRWNALASLSTDTTKGAAKLVSIGDMGYATALLANATSTTGTSEIMFKVGVAATGISALWDHWYTVFSSGVSCNDTDPSGPITFSASLRVVSSTNPGTVTNTIYRLRFNARITVTLDPGGRIAADVLGLSLAVGDVVAIRTYLSSGTAYASRTIYGNFSTAVGGFTSSGDLTAPGSAAIANSQGLYYGPSALLGHAQGAQSAKSVLLLGDSISLGIGDVGSPYTVPTIAPGGFAVRALSGVAGLMNAGVAGDLAAFFQNTSGSAHRSTSATRCNSAIIEYGINDLVHGGATAASLEAILLNLAQDVRRMGIAKAFLTTITPYSTSTDGWATTVNQTVSSIESKRVAHNTWVRAGCPIDPTTLAPVTVGTGGALTAGQFGHPVTGFFDTASTVETSLNSGLWLPAQRITTGSITSGAGTLTSAGATFLSANQESGGDKGTGFVLAGAGASGADLIGYVIAAVTNSTTAVTSAVAGTTVTNAQLGIGVMTFDGTHPAPRAHNLMKSAINPAVL